MARRTQSQLRTLLNQLLADAQTARSITVTRVRTYFTDALDTLYDTAEQMRDKWRGLAEADRPVEGLSSGDGIDTSVVTNSSGKKTITVSAETASTSNAGTVEVATTDEALAGGDQLRSMSPATTEAVVSPVRTTAAGAEGAAAAAQTTATNAAATATQAATDAQAATGEASTARGTAEAAQNTAAANGTRIDNLVKFPPNPVAGRTVKWNGMALEWAPDETGGSGATLTESPTRELGLDTDANAQNLVANTVLGTGVQGSFVGVGGDLPQGTGADNRRFIALTAAAFREGGDTLFTVVNGGIQLGAGVERGVKISLPVRIDALARTSALEFCLWRRSGTGVADIIAKREPASIQQDNDEWTSDVVFDIRTGLAENDITWISVEARRHENTDAATLDFYSNNAGVKLFGDIELKGGARGEGGPGFSDEQAMKLEGIEARAEVNPTEQELVGLVQGMTEAQRRTLARELRGDLDLFDITSSRVFADGNRATQSWLSQVWTGRLGALTGTRILPLDVEITATRGQRIQNVSITVGVNQDGTGGFSVGGSAVLMGGLADNGAITTDIIRVEQGLNTLRFRLPITGATAVSDIDSEILAQGAGEVPRMKINYQHAGTGVTREAIVDATWLAREDAQLMKDNAGRSVLIKLGNFVPLDSVVIALDADGELTNGGTFRGGGLRVVPMPLWSEFLKQGRVELPIGLLPTDASNGLDFRAVGSFGAGSGGGQRKYATATATATASAAITPVSISTSSNDHAGFQFDDRERAASVRWTISTAGANNYGGIELIL